MSIITDALKKAQKKQLDDKNRIDPPLARPSVPVPGQPPEVRKGPVFGKSRALIAGTVLAVAILGVFAGIFIFANRPSPETDRSAQPAVAEESEPATRMIQKEIEKGKSVTEKAFEKFAESFPEPERPASRPVAGELPVLSGIMYSPARPQAVINGIVVSEGDTVNGFSVVKILPGKVKIASGDEEFELQLL